MFALAATPVAVVLLPVVDASPAQEGSSSVSVLDTVREMNGDGIVRLGMSRFPQEVDRRRTSHLLFEVGSLMSLVFGVLFVVGVLLLSAAYTTGAPISVGVAPTGLFGLLAANGVVFLHWSTKVDGR